VKFPGPTRPHICGTKENGAFQLLRKTQRKRRSNFLHRIGEELRQRRHEAVDVQGRWLESVLKGYYAYFAVPTNLITVRNVRHHIKVRWYLSLSRRSQRKRLTWRRMNVVAAKYLPIPSVQHPWPEQRFLVTHSR
jgi:RNA-directed DNA polymerase